MKWAVVFTVAWGLGYAFNAASFDSDLSWTKSLYERKRDIAASLEGTPRLLFAGGSGVHYGVDAMQVEQETGMPSVNFGLHAGLGLNAILRVALESLRPGDVVVAIPEYGILQDADGGGWLSGPFGAAIREPGVGGFGPLETARETFRAGVTNQMSLGKGVFVALFGASGRTRPLADSRGSTSVFFPGIPVPGSVEGRMSPQAERRLRVFRDEVHQRGATLFLALPWLLIGPQDHESFVAAGRYADALRAVAPLLCDASLNLQTDPARFSDSSYHLTEVSRRARSTALAQQIRSALGGQQR
jgi:hypothetical protein